MEPPVPSLAPILRSETQDTLLAVVLDNPHDSYFLSELAEVGGVSKPTASREMGLAEEAGIVSVRHAGRGVLCRRTRNTGYTVP